MPIYYGSNKIKEVYKDSAPIKEVYNGSDLVYKKIRKYVITGTTINTMYIPAYCVSPENGWKQGITYTIKLLSIPSYSGYYKYENLLIYMLDTSNVNTIFFVSKSNLFSYIGNSWTWTPDRYYHPFGDLADPNHPLPTAGVCVSSSETSTHIEALIEISWEE